MTKETIAITGAGGFVGRHLVEYFRSMKWRVLALVRVEPLNRTPGVEYVRFRLDEPLRASTLDSVSSLVHCAYQRYGLNKSSDAINVEGARNLIEICKSRDIRMVFLSSFSARRDARSHYGRIKVKIEDMLDLDRDLIIRPGLVVGNGGLCGSIIRNVARHWALPVADGGKQPIQTIAIADLCQIIAKGLINSMHGAFNVGEPQSIRLTALIDMIAGIQEKTVVKIPVPSLILFIGCRVLEIAGLRPPVDSDSVLGLMQLEARDTAGDVSAFGVSLRPLRNCLEELVGSIVE